MLEEPIDLDLDEPDDAIEPPADRALRRRIRGRRLAMAGVGLVVCGAAAGGIWQHHVHDAALDEQTGELSNVVLLAVHQHGVPGTFLRGHDAGWRTMTLPGPTVIYAACQSGDLSVDGRRWACDGKLIAVGPFGKEGDVVRIGVPGSPWAFLTTYPAVDISQSTPSPSGAYGSTLVIVPPTG